MRKESKESNLTPAENRGLKSLKKRVADGRGGNNIFYRLGTVHFESCLCVLLTKDSE